jgi:hypothetical protein
MNYFSYNSVHQVVVCHLCHSCIVPGSQSQEYHLRAEPHRLLGPELKTTLELFSTYSLRTLEELKQHKPQAEDKCQVIEHLAVYDGFYCLQPECQYGTRHARKIRKHMSFVHQIKSAVVIEGVDLLPLHFFDKTHSFGEDLEREFKDVAEGSEVESVLLVEHCDCFSVSIHI